MILVLWSDLFCQDPESKPSTHHTVVLKAHTDHDNVDKDHTVLSRQRQVQLQEYCKNSRTKEQITQQKQTENERIKKTIVRQTIFKLIMIWSDVWCI